MTYNVFGGRLNLTQLSSILSQSAAQHAGDISYKPGNRMLLLSTRPAVTFLAMECHWCLVSIKLCCLETKAHVCTMFPESLHGNGISY